MNNATRRPMGRQPGFSANGDKLTRMRQARGITMNELAILIGRNYKTIWRAETGRPISLTAARRIAEVLTRLGKPVTPPDFIPGWPDDEAA